MTTDPRNNPWLRLVEAARRAPADDNTEAPFGFSTRIAALGMAQARPSLAFAIDRFSWRALAAAVTLMLACVASSYSLIATNAEDEALLQDPVSEYIELSS